MEPKM
ncbi:hypothetical protein FWK35_00038836 [Aphis craccivora]